MPLSDEILERKKKILLAATAIALGSVAFKKNKIIGDKIYHASFWDASQTVLADVIDEAKGVAGRFAGRILRDNNSEIVDIEWTDDGSEPSEELLAEYERVFVDGDWSDGHTNDSLQTG